MPESRLRPALADSSGPAVAARLADRLCSVATATAARVRDALAGAAGTHAYAQYVAHLQAHHPGTPVPTRAEFFRREFSEKWNGVRRCC